MIHLKMFLSGLSTILWLLSSTEAAKRLSTILWLLSSTEAAKPIVCPHCNDVKNPWSCGSQVCEGIEDGCYWQVNRENGDIRVHARCISDDTCHHPDHWHGYPGWAGTFLENGCCFGSHNCSIPQLTASMNKWNHYYQTHPATHAPKATTHHVQKHPTTHPPPVNHFCTVCQGSSSLSQCKKHQRCATGQNKCFMQVNRGYNGAVEIYARCTHDSACHNLQGETWTRNDHFQADVCQACCWGNDCNHHVCQGGAPYSTSTTPLPPTVPYRLTQGNQCHVCTGASCQGSGVTSKCPDAFPYCMNTVENDASGNQLITKKCASEATCQKQWWEDTSGHSICSVLDPAMTYRTTFTCSYCCLTPDCNKDVHPNPTSLFIGTDN